MKAGEPGPCSASLGGRGEACAHCRCPRHGVNRTEALDASRTAIREKRVVLPRRQPLLETFAQHMTCDAKVLDEDEETGIKKYRYIKTGTNHFSLAFTAAGMAGTGHTRWRGLMELRKVMRGNGGPCL